MKLFIMILLAIFASSVTHAAEVDWIGGCNIDATFDLEATPIVTVLAAGSFACAETVTQTDVTEVLDVSQCDHIDVLQWDDADGDADLSTVVGQPQMCPNRTDDDDSCDAFALTEFAGNVYLEGLGANFFRIAATGTTDTAPVRWEVRCVGRASN
jgi:hypothetical protein